MRAPCAGRYARKSVAVLPEVRQRLRPNMLEILADLYNAQGKFLDSIKVTASLSS